MLYMYGSCVFFQNRLVQRTPTNSRRFGEQRSHFNRCILMAWKNWQRLRPLAKPSFIYSFAPWNACHFRWQSMNMEIARIGETRLLIYLYRPRTSPTCFCRRVWIIGCCFFSLLYSPSQLLCTKWACKERKEDNNNNQYKRPTNNRTGHATDD